MEDQKIICHTCHRECKSGEQVAKYTSGYVNYYKCHECYCKSGNLENYQECDVYTRVVGFHTPLSRWQLQKFFT